MEAPLGRARHIWGNVRSSLWFVPTLLVLSHLLLAIGLIEAESLVERELLKTRWPRIFGAGSEGARGMLEAIATSMITVAGVAFSITIVTLSLASSQYTSRVLRNFMQDRSNQTVLGVFLGVFTYCLVVLRTIRGDNGGAFVPSLAVLMALLLALVGVGFLVFFIHHIASSIQASTIIQNAAHETLHAIDEQFPDPDDGGVESGGHSPAPASEQWSVLPARTTGYIQGIEIKALEELAGKIGTVIRMERGIGEFVIESTPLGFVLERDADEDLIRKVNGACTVGRVRTVHQDAGFGIRQIEDIAIKALSPGINDTTTAVICIDYLSAILVRLAPRKVERQELPAEGQKHVSIPQPTFSGFLRQSFDQIRQNAEGNVAILTHLLETLQTIAGQTRNSARLGELLEQAVLVKEVADRTVPAERDRSGINAAMDRFTKTLSVRQTRRM